MSKNKNKYIKLQYGTILEEILITIGCDRVNKGNYLLWKKSDIHKVKQVALLICGDKTKADDLLNKTDSFSYNFTFDLQEKVKYIIKLMQVNKANQETILNEIRLEQL